MRNIDLKSYDLPWDDPKWEKHLQECRVAEVKEDEHRRTVGFWVADQKGTIIRILKMAVTPGYRRKKIGTFLLHDLIRFYNQCESVTSIVGDSQESAMYFLRHHGFNVETTLDNYPTWDGEEKGYVFRGKIIRS